MGQMKKWKPAKNSKGKEKVTKVRPTKTKRKMFFIFASLNQHIGLRLNFLFSICLLLTIAIIVSFVNVFNMRIMENDFLSSCEYNINAAVALKDSKLASTAKTADILASTESIQNGLAFSNTLYLSPIAGQYCDDWVTSIMFLDNNGSSMFSSRSNLKDLIKTSTVKSALEGVTRNALECYSNNITAITAQPIFKDNRQVGVVVVSVLLNDEEALDELKSTSGAEFSIIKDATHIATTLQVDGERIVDTQIPQEVYDHVQSGQVYSGKNELDNEDFAVTYLPLTDSNGTVIGSLFTGKSLKSVYDQNSQTTLGAVIMGVVLFFIMNILLSRFINRSIVKPLSRIVTFSTQVAEGNLGLGGELDEQYQYNQQNEIAQVFFAQLATVHSIKDYIGELDHVLTDLSRGILTTQTVHEYKGDFVGIRDALVRVQQQLITSMDKISDSSNILTLSSDEISVASQALAQGASEQASTVEELTATVDSIFARVNDTAQKAATASVKAVAVGESVNHGNQQVDEMLDAMQRIREGSAQIEKIIKTIEDIAFQTNILALNAAVEAARAGAAGKGFAVVADEVRNLASKSADAARNTSELIQHSLQTVNQGTKIASRTVTVMKDIVTSVDDVIETIEEISNANEEQAIAMGQIQSGLGQVATVVHNNSASAEESAATAQELSLQAKNLDNLVSAFKIR